MGPTERHERGHAKAARKLGVKVLSMRFDEKTGKGTTYTAAETWEQEGIIAAAGSIAEGTGWGGITGADRKTLRLASRKSGIPQRVLYRHAKKLVGGW